MRRPVLALVAALVALPSAAAAQLPVMQTESVWGPHFRVTPYAGLATGFARSEERIIVDNNSANVSFDDVEVSIGSGLATGLSVEGRVYERFSVVASGLWVRRNDTEEYSDLNGTFIEFSGSNMFIAKAGVAMRFREDNPDLQLRRLSAAIFAAPALVVDNPRNDLFTVDQGNMTSWGFNFGLDAEIPLKDRRFAIQGGLEDFVVWWDEDILSQRVDQLNAVQGRDVITVVDAEASHMWIIRLGLTFRFR